MLSRFFLRAAALALAIIFVESVDARVEKLVVVIPVYRELYNQNIGTLLLALHRQDLRGLNFSKIEVWLNVNNHRSVSPDVRLENQETVQLLRQLAQSRRPATNPKHRILQELASTAIATNLNLHIIDQTTPGYEERNIGRVRDLVTTEAIRGLTADESKRVIVAHLDADAIPDNLYARSLVSEFEVGDLQFGLLNMSYADQRDEDPRVYQRKILSDFQVAAHGFRMARDGGMPSGGSPRIVSTAYALGAVGGVPHLTGGEDTELITRLKKAFPTGGKFLDVTVQAGFRAREDGYDAAIYYSRLGEPIEFTPWLRETETLIPAATVYLKNTLGFKEFYEHALLKNLNRRRHEVARHRSLVRVMLEEIRSHQHLLDKTADFPALLDNFWFNEKLRSWSDLSISEILSKLSLEFPFYFSDPLPAEAMTIARMEAATQTFMNRPFLENPAEHFGLAPNFVKRYPVTGTRIISEQLDDFETKWKARFAEAGFGRASAFRDLKPMLELVRTFFELGLNPSFSEKANRLLTRMQSDVFRAIESNEGFFEGRLDEISEFTDLTSWRIPNSLARPVILRTSPAESEHPRLMFPDENCADLFLPTGT